MSVFSNGRALPPEIDLDDWTTYLEVSQESYEEMEDLIEFCDYDPFDNDYKPSFNEKQMAFLSRKADSLLEDFTQSLSSSRLPKSDKLEILKRQSDNLQDKLLFDYIHDRDSACTDFLFVEESQTMDDEFQKCLVFTNIQKILNKESYDPDDKEIIVALNNYKANLNNTLWGEPEKENFKKWRNCMTGSGNVVLTKIMDDKIKDMAEEVSKSPDYIHIKKVKKNPENVHVHMKHKRKGMDWDR